MTKYYLKSTNKEIKPGDPILIPFLSDSLIKILTDMDMIYSKECLVDEWNNIKVYNLIKEFIEPKSLANLATTIAFLRKEDVDGFKDLCLRAFSYNSNPTGEVLDETIWVISRIDKSIHKLSNADPDDYSFPWFKTKEDAIRGLKLIDYIDTQVEEEWQTEK